ncbi:hypothetical protein HOLleu_32799 [Holothuria leucospilota]|uniref:Uncharacterized protein n=1 Tax=Holothuria leucospilota TaxID=206669 RepID=A0A9Q1BJE9_HOLLE|nr:hypothetical protein HOLleu_32799 [Holothuria leucospilota]
MDIVKVEGVTVEEINLRVEEFDKRLKALDEIQEQIQELITEEDDLLKEIEQASTVRNKAFFCKSEAVRVIGQIKASSTGPSVSTGKSLSSTRLPKLELPKFSGDITTWQTFWDKFVAIVDISDIPVINKFTYLQSLLEGDALLSIQGLSLTDSHYRLACYILKESNGRKERI